jgi:rubrerythrin
MFTIGDVIDMAVQIEENAEKFLRDAAKKAANPELASVLQWLADEEAKHADKFSEMKQEFQETVEDTRIRDMGKALLQNSLGDQTFSLKDVDLSSLDQVETLLKRVIEFENDTILFYELIRSFVKEQGTRDFLDAIIREEESHVGVLEEFLGGEGDWPSTNGSEKGGRK